MSLETFDVGDVVVYVEQGDRGIVVEVSDDATRAVVEWFDGVDDNGHLWTSNSILKVKTMSHELEQLGDSVVDLVERIHHRHDEVRAKMVGQALVEILPELGWVRRT